MSYLSFIKRRFNNNLSTLWGDFREKKDPDVFRATGSQIYHGRQRQGKTLSMVHDFHRLKRRYPKLLVVSNISIQYRIVFLRRKFLGLIPYEKTETRPFNPVWVKTEAELNEIYAREDFKKGLWQQKNYIRYQSYDSLLLLLRKARNGEWGTQVMIDEIHQYFHSHDSKSMPAWVVQIFSQQMKQFVLITGTVQKWPNVIKALREQIENLILCSKTLFRIRQVVIDPEDIEMEYGEETAPIKKRGGYNVTKLVRESYDTLALIETGRELFGGVEAPSIHVNTEPNKKQFYTKRRTRVG